MTIENDIVAGRNPVLEALRGARRVMRLYCARGLTIKGAAADVLSMAEEQGIFVVEIERAELGEMAGIKAHQGMVAEVEPFKYLSLKGLLENCGEEEAPLFLLLDGVEDPQNLGSLIRVAEGAGCSGLVVGHRRSSPVTTVVCKASAGAVEHLPIARVPGVSKAIDLFKSSGIWVVGADQDGEIAYHEVDLVLPTAVVLGGEGEGLKRLTKEKCDLLVSISLYGEVGSLNVATAGAVILFEARRQREIRMGDE